jgi:quercetin 2,3-dioxygenase
MITVRAAQERHHVRRRKQEVWHTFQAGAGDVDDGFGVLRRFDEERIPPGGAISARANLDAEVMTYVREGVLTHEDSMGHCGVLQAGEFRLSTARRGVHQMASNASSRDSTQVFRIWLCKGGAELTPEPGQKRLGSADRRGMLCVVVSPDARRGSLRTNQDALICSALLDAGQHVAHELVPGRSAWLHLVRGEVTLGDVVLSTGDGAGFTAEHVVSLIAREASELLLVDVPEGPAVDRVSAAG